MTQSTESPFLTQTSSHAVYSSSLFTSFDLFSEGTTEGQNDENGFVENPPEADYIERAGIVPVAFLGTLGNIIALIVWTAETRYNATTLLLKHLCVWDSLFLLMYATLLLGGEAMSAKVFYATELFIAMFQLMSVHVTLAAIVTRLLAVTRPLHVRDLLTRRRVYVVYVGIIVWCLLLVGLEIVAYNIKHLEGIERWIMLASCQVIGLILPHVALLVSNVYLFYFLRRHRAVSRPSLQRNLSDTKTKAGRRLTVTLICMSVCSLIAYPLGVFFQLLMEGLINSSSTCDRDCSVIVERVFHLLQVLNSSINIIFYLAFSTRFRHLGLHRSRRVRHLGRSLTRSPSLSSSKRSTETPGL